MRESNSAALGVEKSLPWLSSFVDIGDRLGNSVRQMAGSAGPMSFGCRFLHPPCGRLLNPLLRFEKESGLRLHEAFLHGRDV
jgi:hypothetical protein